LKSLDNSVVVKAVNGVGNRADDGDCVVFGKLALCEGAVKKPSAVGELKER